MNLSWQTGALGAQRHSSCRSWGAHPAAGASCCVWPCLYQHRCPFWCCHPLCLQIWSTPFLSFPACGLKALKQNQSAHLDPVSHLFRSQVNKEFLSHSLSTPHFMSSACYLISQERLDVRSSISVSDIPILLSFTTPVGRTNLTPNKLRDSIV